MALGGVYTQKRENETGTITRGKYMNGHIAPLGFRFSSASLGRRITLVCVRAAQHRWAMRSRNPDATSRHQSPFMSFTLPKYPA